MQDLNLTLKFWYQQIDLSPVRSHGWDSAMMEDMVMEDMVIEDIAMAVSLPRDAVYFVRV